jgi:hypothetical protein
MVCELQNRRLCQLEITELDTASAAVHSFIYTVA